MLECRNYRIDGQIYTVSRNEYNSNNFLIECKLSDGQGKYFSTLAEGDWVKLTGPVDQINGQGMLLRDCRQAN